MPSLGWELEWVLVGCDCLRQLRPCPRGCLVLSWGVGGAGGESCPTCPLGTNSLRGGPQTGFSGWGADPQARRGRAWLDLGGLVTAEGQGN